MGSVVKSQFGKWPKVDSQGRNMGWPLPAWAINLTMGRRWRLLSSGQGAQPTRTMQPASLETSWSPLPAFGNEQVSPTVLDAMPSSPFARGQSSIPV